jgi:hypothetical protein
LHGGSEVEVVLLKAIEAAKDKDVVEVVRLPDGNQVDVVKALKAIEAAKGEEVVIVADVVRLPGERKLELQD